MYLSSTTEKLQAILDTAPATDEATIIVSYQDISITGVVKGKFSVQINTNGNTTVDIVSPPAANTVREIMSINILNEDTSPIDIRVYKTVGIAPYMFYKATMQPKEVACYTFENGWSTSYSSGTGGGGGGGVTNVIGISPIASSGGTSPVLTIQDAVADGATKGAATFAASDFNSTSGLVSIDYTNGQAASASTKGFLTSANWSTFNGKQDPITLTTTGSSGAATLVGSTLNIPQYSGGGGTDSINWTHTEALSGIGSTVKAEPVYGTLASTVGTAINPISQRLYLLAVWLPKATVLTGVKWVQNTVGTYVASNYNGVGLYTLSSGTFTRVAFSTNDGGTWALAGGNTLKQKAFSSTYSASAGLYYAAMLYSSSSVTTNPAILSIPNASYNQYTLDNTNGVYLSMFSNSQASMPATVTIPGSFLQSSIPYLALY